MQSILTPGPKESRLQNIVEDCAEYSGVSAYEKKGILCKCCVPPKLQASGLTPLQKNMKKIILKIILYQPSSRVFEKKH